MRNLPFAAPEAPLDPDRLYAGSGEYSYAHATLAETTFRHSGWSHRRRLVWNALRSINARTPRLCAFNNCGSQLWLERTADRTDLRLRCNRCHDRWCLPCQNERARCIAGVLQAEISKIRDARFITLTRRHSDAPLADQLSSMLACFAALRRRRFWISHVRGGAAFVECKLSKTGRWHVHIHCIVAAAWVPQKQLSTEWLAVTNDSSIVDVRPIAAADRVAHYVTKYVTKPADATVYADPGRLAEMISALRGRRLCATFGSWRGINLHDPIIDEREWVAVGSVTSLRSRARDGDDEAGRWMEAALRRWPALSQLLLTTASADDG